ncbi:MAG: GntR family transcriptional regulator [Sedimentisphaeraceae bacterium JB056]
MFEQLTIDRCSGKPVSSQIAHFVKQQIANNELSPGDKFPTTQEFVKNIGVGPHTVRQAMKALEKEGLVRCTPRLGTVVCEKAYNIVSNNTDDAVIVDTVVTPKFRRIGVLGLFQKVTNGGMRYCVETAEGITSECERLGVTAIILPNKLQNMKAQEIYQELMGLGCEGLIWMYTERPDDPILFDYLNEKGIKIIFKRRSQANDGRPCIDADYETAGYKTGQYFHENGIKDLLVFSHFDFNTADAGIKLQSCPTMLKSGLLRAYEHNYLEPNIEVNVHINEDTDTSKRIYSKLCQIPDTTGVIFTNGYQLLNYLSHNGLQGYELLRTFKIVAVSNLTINYQLRPFVNGLDLMVLVDNFKESGKLIVGNLIGMLEGYFDSGATTLTGVDFSSFEDSFKN